jgi:hypothetical protein
MFMNSMEDGGKNPGSFDPRLLMTVNTNSGKFRAERRKEHYRFSAYRILKV